MSSTDRNALGPAPAPPVIVSSRPARSSFWWVLVPMVVVLLFFVWAAVGITGYFRLGSDTKALRQAALDTSGGSWHKVVGLRVGWLTTAALRAGLHFVKLDPDARSALQVVRGAEVCVYDLRGGGRKTNSQTLMDSADQAMLKRGFERAATVCRGNQMVIVYLSPSHFSSARLRCCVLVLQNRRLVVAAVNANLEPALQLVQRYWDSGERHFPEVSGLALHD